MTVTNGAQFKPSVFRKIPFILQYIIIFILKGGNSLNVNYNDDKKINIKK